MKLNRLKNVFDDQKIKNRVIAVYLGKSESTISLWRNNKRQPSLEEFYQIAKLLRVNIHSLIESTNWKDETAETYKDFAKKYIDKKNT
ncbi:helix-turn-helix domain-containing protein [Flavobacterium granuli]|uniref:Helix-turn-helix n=1 Tax=Flavobacterium granuli TaxID=280093 RepID=A0A1M5U366_9FLAO|nr:helix-turn-helix transcriptional regulator [Flavobacterium granuli]PRZ19601.1 helix-turn-helix protein [Flavobacterium granuli]SHH57409.1 Helix-turn-helix [Flavobacterium granuli]